MRIFTVALVAVLFLADPGGARATQGTSVDPPQASALSGLAQRLAGAKPSRNGGSATRFTPSGKRLTLETLVNSLGKSPEEKKGLRQVFAGAFTAYEVAAQKAGMENDVAAALAFYLCVHYSTYHDGQDVSDADSEALARQLQAALDSDAMRSAKNEDKQKLYEYFVMMGGFTAATLQLAIEQKDAALKKQVHQIGGDGLRSVLKIAPERIRITETGLTIALDANARPAAAAASPPPSAAGTNAISNVSYRIPAQWTEKKSDGAITLQRSTGDDFYGHDTTTLVLTSGWEKTGRINAAFPAAWHDLILATFEGEQHPFVYVRRLGNGMNCAFAFANMKTKSNGHGLTVFLYLLDTGKGCYPVIGMFVGDQSKYMNDVEQILASIQIAGASPPAPLVTAAEFVGDWSTSDRAYGSYVDTAGNYRGDATIATSTFLYFHADGTYTSSFQGISGGHVTREKAAGTFKIEGDMLILSSKAGQVEKKRFLGMEPLPNGKGKMMVFLNPGTLLLSGNIGLYGEKYVLIPK